MTEVVIPGDKLAEGNGVKAGHGAFRKGDAVYASVMGLANVAKGFAKVVPLKGTYMPHSGDHVIGVVEAKMGKGCFVDINAPYNGYLSFFGDKVFEPGELLIMEITHVNEIYKTDLDFAKPLYGGKLIEVSPVKIPRIVGRKASMVETLSNGSNCRIFIGRNGRIYLKGKEEDIARAEAAIRLIEREAHTKGLTDRVKSFLETGEKDGNEE